MTYEVDGAQQLVSSQVQLVLLKLARLRAS